jgi:hypothetical protein
MYDFALSKWMLVAGADITSVDRRERGPSPFSRRSRIDSGSIASKIDPLRILLRSLGQHKAGEPVEVGIQFPWICPIQPSRIIGCLAAQAAVRPHVAVVRAAGPYLRVQYDDPAASVALQT